MKNVSQFKVEELSSKDKVKIDGGWDWDAFLWAVSPDYRAFKAFLRGEQ